MLNAKSILSLSIFIIFKLIYTVSTFYRTRQALFKNIISNPLSERTCAAFI